MLSIVLKYCGLWLMSMAWHLNRIAVGRPAFDLLADTSRTVISFHVLFYVTLIALDMHQPDYSFAGSLALAVLVNLVTLLLWERSYRSSTLVCVMLGTVVIFKLMAEGLAVSGLVSEGWAVILSTCYWIYLQIRATYEFSQAPAAVQRSGYKRSA